MYDSIEDTLKHIQTVQSLFFKVLNNLGSRAVLHDKSKLQEPEKSIFDKYTPLLKNTTYGSDEYNQFLKEMKVGLDHHYQCNSHHPEHYPNGIKDMSLLDLIEMICDWKAATLRHADGDILSSIEKNQKRFGYSDELKNIFLNTIKELGL